jgi:hypothetical protein
MPGRRVFGHWRDLPMPKKGVRHFRLDFPGRSGSPQSRRGEQRPCAIYNLSAIGGIELLHQVADLSPGQ